MTKQDFETFLDAKARESKERKAIDWDTRKREWLRALGAFYADVESWLSDYVTTGKVVLKDGTVTLVEEYLGTYQAESRAIAVGAERVTLEPIGTLLIGVRGRVDMEGPKGRAMFVLTGRHSNGIRVSISLVPREGSAPLPALECKEPPPEEWVWKLATPPPKVQFIELTAEVFFDTLMAVVNG